MIPAQLYYPIYIYTVLLLCIMKAADIYRKTDNQLLRGEKYGWNKVLFIGIVIIFFLGTRPTNTHLFGDTINYITYYNAGVAGGAEKEILWEWMWETFRSLGYPFESFMFLVECIYILPTIWACKRLSKENSYLIWLFVISSFSFYSFGVNGIRNGAACSLVILAITYFNGNIRQKILSVLISLVAFNIHHTSALPIGCMLLSYYAIKDVRWGIVFWAISILISLFLGNQAAIAFTGLGFDDRLDSYILQSSNAKSMQLFSSVGFRWDFLLYSAMPIWLGWYVVVKRKIFNKQYLLILNTYILANAFWVMVITAAYSNRFAYLSWFLYPIVIAYPLIKFRIWKNQGQATALILIGHVAFTFLMYLIGR